MSLEDLDRCRLRIQELEGQVRMLEEQLVQVQKTATVGALASSITHEFNNILTTIINYAKMGIRHKDVATREKSFEKILAAGYRASKITTGMLSYARRQHDRREPMNLVGIVEDVLILVEKDLQIHRVRLEKQFEDRPWASVNSGQVQQVLLNLIINARQAMGTGGTLVVGLRSNAAENFAEVWVKDTGPGIPATQLKQIFEPYYTTKAADANGQGGTGLGLSLARNIMESHQGRIRVESAVGKGTCFTLKFPLVTPVTPVTPGVAEPAPVTQKTA